jgi:hypothetical protein
LKFKGRNKINLKMDKIVLNPQSFFKCPMYTFMFGGGRGGVVKFVVFGKIKNIGKIKGKKDHMA